jgi:dTDP-4-amino-4,6-dideoxygalactose transaminase
MIPYGRQSINREDIAAVVKALKSEWLTTGPVVQDFESALEKISGAPTFVVSSGTAALHCAFYAIGIQPGDEIIGPPLTFIATYATAIQFGAVIKFADVNSDTGTINVDLIEPLIGPKTKAIVAVDYAGHPCDLTELKELANKYGLFLIEDAAHSIGSTYKGHPVGSLADLTTFSFFPTKNLTTAEGGAVSSNNPELFLKAKRFSRQGLVREKSEFEITTEGAWHQEVHEFGLNYRLPDVLCALGLSQVTRLGEFKKKRRSIYSNYINALKDIENVTLPVEKEYADSNWHLFPLRVNPEKREHVFQNLRSAGILVQVNYIPAYWMPAFVRQGYRRGLCPEAEKYYSQEISLPLFPDLTPQQFDFIIHSLKQSLNE